MGLNVLGPGLYCLISGSCGTQCIGTSSLLFDDGVRLYGENFLAK